MKKRYNNLVANHNYYMNENKYLNNRYKEIVKTKRKVEENVTKLKEEIVILQNNKNGSNKSSKEWKEKYSNKAF